MLGKKSSFAEQWFSTASCKTVYLSKVKLWWFQVQNEANMRLYDHIVHRSDQLTISFSFHLSFCLFVCVSNILVCPKLGKRGQNEAKIAQWTIFQNMLDFPQRGPWLPKRTVLFCIENFSCHQLGKREQNWLRKWPLCLFINIFALDFSDFFNEGIEISFHNQNH